MALTHATKMALVTTVATLMESNTVESITSDQVLEISGISRGSLYHHFEDFSELIEAAQVYRFTQYIDKTLAGLTDIIETASTREELLKRMKDLTMITHTQEMRSARLERIGAISKALNHPRMQATFGAEQERLTKAVAEKYSEACAKGFGNKKLDPIAVSVFIQAYSMGKAVDDFTGNQMSPDSWNLVVGEILDKVIFNPS